MVGVKGGWGSRGSGVRGGRGGGVWDKGQGWWGSRGQWGSRGSRGLGVVGSGVVGV